MTNNKLINNLSEISAELLLGYLYPELTGKWMSRHVGTFYRNYNSDVMAVYPDEPTVILSRDGFLKLLPQGMLDGDDKLQMQVLRDAFLPIDAFWFNTKLQIELQVSQLLRDKLTYVLREFFHYDLEAEPSPLVRKAAVILPYVRSRRGDFAFVSELLATLMHCEVQMRVGRYSDTDTTVCRLPMLTYELIIPELTQSGYERRSAELEPLSRFIREWLIPAEVKCMISIRWHDAPTDTPTGHLLDYNTRVALA